jgi:ABC-2 type transport system ATP-binding protein
VKELRSQGMTVIYTTHYMEEAAELSSRVGIIDHGRLIALGTQKELTRLVGEQIILRLHLADDRPTEPIVPLFSAVRGVIFSRALDSQLVLSVADSGQVLPEVMLTAHQAGVPVRSIDIEEPNLESVFLHLTGRALRDQAN